MGASLETGNMGVSALATSVLQLVLRQHPRARLSLFVTQRRQGPQFVRLSGELREVEVIDCGWSVRALFQGRHVLLLLGLAWLYSILPIPAFRRMLLASNARLQRIHACAAVGEIFGGDSFSDIYGLWLFLQRAVPDIIVTLLGHRLCFLPQTYGPYRHRVSQWLARWLLCRAGMILSRDQEGISMVRALTRRADGSTARVQFCPDVAFALEAAPAPASSVVPPLPVTSGARRLVGLNVSGLLYHGGYTRQNMFDLKLDYPRFVADLAAFFLEKTDASLLFVPHVFGSSGAVEDDLEACQRVFELYRNDYPDRVHLVATRLDQSELKQVIGRCGFFVGSRMHACIAALSQGIPAIGVAYSRKFAGVFASVGMETLVVDGCMASNAEALQLIADRFASLSLYRDRLAAEIPQATGPLHGMFAGILGGGAPLFS